MDGGMLWVALLSGVALATVLRPPAASLSSFAVRSGWPTPSAQLVAIVLGTMALTVHGLKANLRLGSTVVALGLGNAFRSLLDEAFARLLVAGAVFGSAVVLVAIPTAVCLRSRRRAGVAASAIGAGPIAPLSPAR